MHEFNCIRCGRVGCDGKNDECHAPDTRNEQLKLIREKCIEANPEIAELKEGCIVLVGDAMLPHTVYGIDEGLVSAYLNKPFPQSMEANDFYDCEFGKDYGGNLKILGRPIRLADVLLAMQEADKQKVTYFPGLLTGLWNLRKDDLTEQSDECIAFLYELLK